MAQVTVNADQNLLIHVVRVVLVAKEREKEPVQIRADGPKQSLECRCIAALAACDQLEIDVGKSHFRVPVPWSDRPMRLTDSARGLARDEPARAGRGQFTCSRYVRARSTKTRCSGIASAMSMNRRKASAARC